MRWTQEMKRKAAKAIQALGGADKATPKKLLLALAFPGLTMLQVSRTEARLPLACHGVMNSKRVNAAI